MSTEFDDDDFETLEHRAAYWHLRLTSDECTPEDRYAFEAWKRQAPEHAEAYQRVQRGNAFIDRHVAEPELRRLAEETMERTAPPLHRRRWAQVAAMAACLALAAGIAAIMAPRSSPADEPATIVVQVEAYETEVGERSTIDLSDGSTVTLNTNSRLEVRYSASERNVALIRGQGYFDVARDVDRPFSVDAGRKRVVALGTAFDVRIDEDNDVEVTLVEGRVSVDDIVRAASGQPIETENPEPSPTALELTPGQRLVARADVAPEVMDTNASEATSWREGRLIFRDRPIGDVIDEMNRYSAQKLKLSDDPRLHEMTVSGVFNTGRASTFVDALVRMHPLEAERTGSHELTLVWHE